jgi:DNA repair exonuclease SbcCD ATPase subunit
MQQFVRTVNTTDAFKMKLEQLEKEYERKVEPIKTKIKALNKEIQSLSDVGTGAGIGGGIVKFLGTALAVIFGIILAIGIIVSAMENETIEGDDIAVIIFVVIGFIVGLIIRYRGNAIITRADQRRAEAEQKQANLRVQMEQLEKSIKEHYAAYQEELRVQETVYQQHMLNQQELIEQEVQAMNQTAAAASSDDHKECPQCAEIIKAKAKICRFCHYKFDIIDL